MPLKSDSPEFARLVATWLDGTSTAEEAARLWQAVREDEACALEFAAAARFEALLMETVQEQAGEKKVMGELAAGPMPARRPARRIHTSLRPMALAAALAVLGIGTWLLWPQAEAPQVAHSPTPKPPTPAVSREEGPPIKRLAAVSHSEDEAADDVEVSLPDRLDRFFLGRVALDQVPLQRALGLLQGQLLELNFLNAEALKKLRITVPTDAAGRRVTFRSGPISFLKAVRAISALAGCDMTVDEATLALILHRETYPQLPNRKDVREMLAGRVNADGTAAADDPERVAALMADAASLGITVDPTRPLAAQAALPITRGQWQALKALTDAREQLGRIPAPSFQLYFTNDSTGTDRVLDQDEASQMQQRLEQDSTVQTALITPAINFTDAHMLAGLTVQPLGEATQFTLSLPPADATDTARAADPEVVTGVLLAGQAAAIHVSGGASYSVVADSLKLGGASLTFALDRAVNVSASTSVSQIVIIANPPP